MSLPLTTTEGTLRGRITVVFSLYAAELPQTVLNIALQSGLCFTDTTMTDYIGPKAILRRQPHQNFAFYTYTMIFITDNGAADLLPVQNDGRREYHQ